MKKRIRCKSKNCNEWISKYYAKKHEGLCMKCYAEMMRKRNGE